MELKNSCQAFFMEVISTLSFGGIDGPEPQLVRLLLDMVFIDGEDEQVTTQELTPYKGEQDSVPVIRSFILQLLLEHRFVVIQYSCILLLLLYMNTRIRYEQKSKGRTVMTMNLNPIF